MAPINIDLQGWDAAGSSGVTVLSLLILFTLAILVLTLCASCRKQSFELEGAKVQRNSSSLVRVVKLEEAVEGTQNPRADDIQTDEIDLTPIPEDGAMAGPLEWRSHTHKGPDLDKVLGNGTSGGVTVNASTPQFNMGI
ncbi:uncharacterized protein si:ch73-204p21.2 isoform X2 [Chanos chanos]|uniref:Uncharacterized protein si:ch73-204p21.2 isoform X2 n=1 Tax=Chanos chanos TaxID=29144 RepID=A0A6J2WF12_CHACN|nr:uncharacterized protein LOC115823061 isoform X2 [Chanos chanos]